MYVAFNMEGKRHEEVLGKFILHTYFPNFIRLIDRKLKYDLKINSLLKNIFNR